MPATTKSRNATSRRKPAMVAPRNSATVVAKSKQRRSASPPAVKTRSTAKSDAATPSSKQSRLVALLRSPAGATLAQMMALTGWQAHSVRGVISGVLRKRLGLAVQCDSSGEHRTRVYRIGTANAT